MKIPTLDETARCQSALHLRLCQAAAVAACLVLLPATGAAQGHYTQQIWDHARAVSGDFDGDGAVDVIRFSESGAQFQTGCRVTHPDFIWLPAVRSNPFGGITGGVRVAAGDVNNDGTDDLLISSFTHNAIAVFHGSTARANALASHELKRVGAGPAGMVFGQFDTTTPWLELAVPLLAEIQPRTVQVRPQSGWSVATAPLDPMAGTPVSDCEGFVYLSDALLSGGTRHTGRLGAYLFRNGTGSRLRAARFSSSAPALEETLTEPWTQLLAADMRGPNAPGQVVLWAPGLDSLSIGTMTTPGGNSGAPAREHLAFTFQRITWISDIGGPGRDRLAVLHDDGGRISVVSWNGAQFTVEQTLEAPAGRTFKKAGGLKWRTFEGGGLMLNGGLFLELSDGTFATRVFNAGGVLVTAAQGALPALPATGGHATVMLYTDDPLSGEAFEFQSFAAGDWASEAGFSGGQVGSISEIFQSPALGLGSPAAVRLTPFASPGTTAQAQGNQFGDASSSLFFAGGVSMDGYAAVSLSPPSGVYVGRAALTFAPAQPGTTVRYRVNGGAWQQAGALPLSLTTDAAVEYYGQSAGGAPGTIRRAHYEILPAGGGGMEPLPPNLRGALNDTDGDRLDDGFELRAFNSLANNFDDDSDGDGFFNGEEYFLLTDPASAASRPQGVTTTPRNITVTREGGVLCVCWDGRPDAKYTVLESSGLEMNSWLEAAQAGIMQTAPGRFQWTNSGAAPRLFFRVVTVFE